MKIDACPDRETLTRLLLGDLSAAEREVLGEHLSQCDRCLAAAATINASDPITAAIGNGREYEADEEILAEAIQRGKQLRAETETVESIEDTVGVERRKAEQDRAGEAVADIHVDVPIDFLHPAEQPDEIGRLGGYRVLEVMGVGGMGVVFRAEDPKLERLVALKAMKPEIAASKLAKDRFLREAKATAAIEHDNIVHIYQVGEDGGVPFIAMQFLRGESLKSQLKRERRLNQREVVRIGREVAAGLAAAHKQALIHRDIKPDNVWIEAETGRARILDFGLVRTTTDDAGLTQSGMVVGTPRYMAPEQAQGQEIDQRCDLFSLGSVLYHLASGRPPFKGDSLTATLVAVVHDDPKPLQAIGRSLNDDLAELIMRLLSKDPAERPQTADEVLQQLEDLERQLDEQARQAELALTSEMPDAAVSGPTREDVLPQISTVSTIRQTRAVKRRRSAVLIATGVVGALLLPLGVIVVATAKGTVTVSIPDQMQDDVEVRIWGEHDVVAVLDKKNRWKVELRAGEYKLEVKGGKEQFHLRDNRLTVTRFGRSIVKIDYSPALVSEERQPPRRRQPNSEHTHWQPGPGDNVLSGIVPRPANLPGIGRWQVETARPRSGIRHVAWSPDGKRIACGTWAGSIRIYDAATLRLVQFIPAHVIPGYSSWINCMAWSPDGQWLCSVGADSVVRIWNADGRPGPMCEGHQYSVFWIAWSPDSQRLATAGADGTVRLWAVDGEAGPVIDAQAGQVRGVDWSPDGKMLASTHADGAVRIWSSAGTPGTVLRGDEVAAVDVAWSRDGTIVSTDDRATLRFWSQDGKVTKTLEGVGKDVAWSPDGKRLAVGGWNSGVRVLGADGETLWQSDRAESTAAHSPTWASDGRRLVSLHGYQTIRFWDAEKAAPVDELQSHWCDFNPIAWNLQGDRLASGGRGHAVRLWDADGTTVANLKGHTGQVTSVAWSPLDDQLASGSEDDTVRIWKSDAAMGPILTGHSDAVTCVEWSADAKRLVTGGRDKTVRLWRASGAPGLTLRGHKKTVRSVSWSEGDRWIASAGEDQTIRFWKADGAPGPVVDDFDRPVWTVSWSPVAPQLASVSKNLRLWDEDGSPVAVLHKNESYDGAMCWSSDGQWIASSDGWGFSSRILLSRPDGRGGPVMSAPGEVISLAWRPGSRQLAYGNRFSNVAVVDTETGQHMWLAVLLDQGKSVSFTPAGEILHGDAETVENELVYLIEAHDGTLELLKPAEFQKRVAAEEDAPAVSENLAPGKSSPLPRLIAPFTVAAAKQHQQAWADYLGLPVEKEITLGQDKDGQEVKLNMVLIPPGEFLMGTMEEQQAALLKEAQGIGDNGYLRRIPSESPQHRVRITKPFWLSRHEVTVGQFRQFVEDEAFITDAEREGGGFGTVNNEWRRIPESVWNGEFGFSQTDDHPVVDVSWNDATSFCDWLTSQHGGTTFTLPTEAQWAYACRAGTATDWYCGSEELEVLQCGWLWNNSKRATHAVGQLRPNGFGLYDMHGNVFEWCGDWYTEDYYANSPIDDPTGPAQGSRRVNRGGCWNQVAASARSAHRAFTPPNHATPWIGFRVAAPVELPEQPAAGDTTSAEAYQWPADTPPPAFAPFTPVEATEHQQPWADHSGLPVTKEISFGQDQDGQAVSLTMSFIPPGEFLMGSQFGGAVYPASRLKSESRRMEANWSPAGNRCRGSWQNPLPLGGPRGADSKNWSIASPSHLGEQAA